MMESVSVSIPLSDMKHPKENSSLYQFHTPEELNGLPNQALPPRAVWQGFKTHTTAHGIPHVDNARGPIKKIFWTLIFIACLSGLSYHTWTLATRYMRYDVNVKIEILHKRAMDFPAVTVCNSNAVKQSQIHKVEAIRELVQTYSSSSETAKRRKKRAAPAPPAPAPAQPGDQQTEAPLQPDDQQTQAPPQPDDQQTQDDQPLPGVSGGGPPPGGSLHHNGRPQRHNAEFREKIMQVLADLPVDEKIPLGHQKEDFIIDCEYSGYDCNITTDFDQFYNSKYGNCFTYNWGLNNSKLQTSYRPGPDYGLSMIFHLEQPEYIGELAEAAGLRIVVHPQEKMPFPEDEGLSITPGRLTYIGVNLLTVTRLSQKYSNCTPINTLNWTRSVFEEQYSMNYSSTACYRTCYQKWVIENCDCADPQFPSWGKAFDYRQVAACNSSDDTKVSCKENVTRYYRLDRLPCSCPMPCQERMFQPMVSAIRWPSELYSNSLRDSLAGINDKLKHLAGVPDNDIFDKSLAKVVVYFQEFNYQSLSDMPDYPGDTFVSDLGGILGLYIGFSVMTILEFGELFMDFIVLVCYKCSHRDVKKIHNGPKGAHMMSENYPSETKKFPPAADSIPPPYMYNEKHRFSVGHS